MQSNIGPLFCLPQLKKQHAFKMNEESLMDENYDFLTFFHIQEAIYDENISIDALCTNLSNCFVDNAKNAIRNILFWGIKQYYNNTKNFGDITTICNSLKTCEKTRKNTNNTISNCENKNNEINRNTDSCCN